MNHTYRVVYNETTNTYIAVAENVPARGKSSKSQKALAAVVAAAALQLTAVSAEAAVSIGSTNGNSIDSTATATGNNIAIGENANVTSPKNSIAIGANTTVAGGVGAGEGAVAIGHKAHIAGENGSVAIGENSSVGLYLTGVTHRWYQNPYNGHANQTKLPANPANEAQIVSNGNLVETVSVAVGRNSVAQGSSTAIGANAVAKVGTGRSGALDRRALSVAIGSNTLATSGGVSIGGSTAATGYNSVAIGRQAASVGDGSSAYGVSAAAVGDYSTAFGQSATAFGNGSIAFGSAHAPERYQSKDNTMAYGTNAIAVGSKARAGADNAVAVANSSVAGGTNSIAVGLNATAGNATLLQNYNQAEYDYNIALGQGDATDIATKKTALDAAKKALDAAAAKTANATAIGTNANASGEGSIAFGASASAGKTITLGALTYSNHHSIAIGTNAAADAQESVVLGHNAKALGVSKTSSDIVTSSNPATVVIGTNAASRSNRGDTIVGGMASNDYNQTLRISQSTIIGSRSRVFGDQATALGSDTSAIGNSSFAIGGDDFDSAQKAIETALGKYKDESGYIGNSYTSLDKTITDKVNALTGNNVSAVNAAIGSSSHQNSDSARRRYVRTAAIGDASIAFGTMAQAGGVASIAEGTGTIARGDLSVALGPFADTYGKRSIAIGALAKTSDAKAIDAISIGTNSTVSGNSSIAIGTSNLVTGDFSGALGDPSIVAGTNSYSVGNNNIIANNTDNAISIGGQNNIGGIAGKRDATTGVVSVADGVNNMAGANRSMVMGFRNKVFGADDSMVIGNNNNVTAPNVMVLGNNITTEDENAVILGNKSSGNETATSEISATVNGVTYSSFTGTPAASTHYVSVGAKGDERQIKNVAAGKISEDSTDAINGSQLYLIANQITTTTPLFNQENGTVGATTVNNTPNLVNATTVANAINKSGWNVYQGDTTTPANKKDVVNPGDNVVFANGKGTTATVTSDDTNTTVKYDVNKAGVNTTPTNAADENNVTINEAGKVVAPTNNTVAGNTFLTAKDVADVINNSGFKLSANGTNSSVVNPGELVDLNNTDGNIVISKKDTDNNVTFNLNNVVKVGDNSTTATTNNHPITIDGNNGTVSGLVNNLPDTYNQDAYNTGHKPNTTAQPLPSNLNVNNAATVGDVLNAGWNLQENGSAKDFVKAYDTVNFVNGVGTTANVTVDPNGTVADVTYNVNADGKTTEITYVDKAGNTVYKQADGSYNTQKDGKGDTVDAKNIKGSQISAIKGVDNVTSLTNGTTTTVTNKGTAEAPNYVVEVNKANVTTTPTNTADENNVTINEAGKVVAPTNNTVAGNTFLTAKDVANVINNSGFTLTSSNGGTSTGQSDVINPGDKVTIDGGKNINITQKGSTITVATKDDVTFTNVNTTTMTVGSPTNAVNFKAEAATQANNNPTDKTPTTALNITSADGKPTQITGVASSLNTTTVATNPSGNTATTEKPATLVDLANASNVNAAATVGDLQNMGWVVSADGGYTDVVKNSNEVKFTGSGAAKVTGSTDEKGVRTINVSVDTGTISTSGGSATATGGSLATVGNVAEAINNSGWNTKLNGSEIGQVNPGDTVNYVNGAGTTASVTKTTDAASKKDTFSVNYNVNTDGVTTDVVYKDDTGNTLVKVGNDYYKPADVVNGKPTATATAVTPTSSQVVAKTTNLTVNNGKVDASTNGDSLVNATTVANAINNSGWNLQANGDTASKVSPGNTVQFLNGDNINITRNGNNITVATSKDIDVKGNLTVAGNTTVNNFVVNPNSNVSMGGNQITNVASGVRNSDGTMPANRTDAIANAKGDTLNNAANIGDLQALQNNVTNVYNQVLGNEEIKTYDAAGNTEKHTISHATAINNINKEGIRFFHTNSEQKANGTNIRRNAVDSSASGTHATAIGYQSQASGDYAVAMGNSIQRSGSPSKLGDTKQNDMVITDNSATVSKEQAVITTYTNKVTGETATAQNTMASGDAATAIGTGSQARGNSSIAIGHGSLATGTQSISIGTKNTVTGNYSGAFGDPNNVTADYAYVVGNNNTVDAQNTFVLGNNVSTVTENSVFLGNGVAPVTKAVMPNITVNAKTGVHEAIPDKGTYYTFRGKNDENVAGRYNAVGIVSVGNDNETRQIQGVAAGVISANSTDAINGSQLYMVTDALSNLANTANSGWNLQANGDTPSKVSPGNTVQFLNGDNINITRNGNSITVATSRDINVRGDLTVAGDTTVNNFTVNPNSTVNMGGNKVQGVAAGVISANSTDAINGSQLYYNNQAIGSTINNVANNLNARINDVADDADAGTASAMATAGIPQAYLPGKSMVAVGASTYRGKQGYAVGFSAISDSGNWIIKGTASGNSRGHFGATVGAGYQW